MSNHAKRITSVILCGLMLLGSVSCSDSGSDDTKSAGTSSGNAASAESETETAYLDNLGDDLDFGDLDVRFVTSRDKKDIIIDEEEDDMADVVNEALWKRNQILEERLSVNITMPTGEEIHYDDFNAFVRSSVSAGLDEYDVYVVHQRFGIELAAEGLMKNLANIEYLDFSQNYWNQNFYNNLAYDGLHYWATGDLSLNHISKTHCLFTNMDMWNQYYADKNLYDMVINGNWTLDELAAAVAGTYVDKNGDGAVDSGDAFGLVCEKGVSSINSFMFGAGTTFTEYNSEGVPGINVATEHNINAYEKVQQFLTTDTNVLFFDDDSIDDKAMFTSNRALFYSSNFGDAETDEIRDMDEDFTLLPYPKYDTLQENYVTTQQDGIGLYGVPITINVDNSDAIGATLECMASLSTSIVYPAYYETALKDKYTRNPETQELVDIIHDSIMCEFCYSWSDSIGYMGNPTITIFSGNFGKESITSAIEKNMKIWEKGLEQLFEKLEDNAQN